jgi:predicted ATPase/class 3 adenylate cyclase
MPTSSREHAVPQQRADSRSAQAALPTGTVTFLFTDIEGSTALLRAAGESYGDLLAEHRRILREAFAAHSGREVDTQGDAFFVAFAGPAQAVGAAVDAQRALAAHPWAPGCAVRVRMGLHSGEAAAVGGSYVSLSVHRAARITAVAHGGQVLVSEATAALVRDELPDGTALRDLGEHRLKDFPRPARLYQLVVAELPADFPPLHSLGRRWHVPTPPGSYVGRDDDIATVVTLLRDNRTRLVTLTGPGGIGKTRLALEAAHAMDADLSGGAVFVPLAAVIDPSLVLSAVGDAVGSRPEPGEDLVGALADLLGSERTLLVLDNLEQVLGAAADVAELLDRIPAAVLLGTSRSPLRLRAERLFAVRPLPETAAVQLFTVRSAAVRPGDGAAGEQDVIAEIARRLDGLPLAIELAAARVRLLPAPALLDRLRRQFDVLGAGPVDLPARQRTLRATMDWSHGLLAPHEQAMFARLAVFSGGWDLEAAESVCARTGEPDVLDTLGALVDASLVLASGNDSEPRFSMLETVRAYAAERLAGSPDRQETERRHASWVLELTEQLLGTQGEDYRRAQLQLERERANYRAAVQRLLDAGDLAGMALLVRNAIGYLAFRDAEVEARTWLDRALARSDDAAPAVRGRLLVLRAVVAMSLGEPERVVPLAQEGEALLDPGPDADFDRALAAVAGIQRGMADGLEGAARAAGAALDRFTALGFEVGEGTMHLIAGDLGLAAGDLGSAARHYRLAADVGERVGEDGMLGRGLILLGLSQLAQEDVASARRSVLDGARANLRAGQQTSMAYSLEGLAAIALADGRCAVAVRTLASADEARHRSSLPLTPGLPPLVRRLEGRCRELLGDEAFARAWEEGRRWSLRQALELALQELSPPSDRPV